MCVSVCDFGQCAERRGGRGFVRMTVQPLTRAPGGCTGRTVVEA